jgi:radical SAM/Cys-rich protein
MIDFHDKLSQHHLELPPTGLATLQVNVGKLCNQACLHCHVDASPKRTEAMDTRTAQRVMEVLAAHPQITTLDITGGAPELNPHFDWLVAEAKKLGKHVMVRHNLTVQFDGNPITGESKEYLPDFFAEHRCEVVSSLPYYSQYFTDKQRGRGVFNKSMEGMKRLNDVGYGKEGTGLVLNLVYNPVGAFLPASQAGLEADYKRILGESFGIRFDHLFTLANMPIQRFGSTLISKGTFDGYMTLLKDAHRDENLDGVMCRDQLSIDWQGYVYDCDFNQMLGLATRAGGRPRTHLRDVLASVRDALNDGAIVVRDHCYGCTAGQGSSCGGALG